MPRIPRLTERFHRSRRRLGVEPGTPDGVAVARVIRSLALASTLPGLGDTRALLPPTREAFVRRAPGRNLWVWYMLQGDDLFIVHLGADPPVPADA